MQQTLLPNNEYFQFSKIDGDAQSLTHGQGLYKASGKSAKRASSCCVPGAGARGCQPSIEKTEAEMRFLRPIRGVKKLWRAFACIHARQSRVPVEVAGRRELQLRRRLQGNRKPSRCSIQVQRYSGTD